VTFRADEVPYKIITRELKGGRVVPFLGAGASATCRPNGSRWRRNDSYLPFGGELAKDLAAEARFPKRGVVTNLALVASYYAEVQSSRRALCSSLSEIFRAKASPGQIHYALAKVERPLLIVTTNYDRLIEQALEENGRRPQIVTDRGDEQKVWVGDFDADPHEVPSKNLKAAIDESRPIVFKMHGSVHPTNENSDSFLITEQDYVNYLGRRSGFLPADLVRQMWGKSFLFLGYSLADWNVRVLLHKIWNSPAGRGGRAGEGEEEAGRSWAIRTRPSQAESRIWEKHRVNDYDVDLLVFANELADHL
jgi:NAD-dependent SIR2 family protein deacetylase